MALLRDQLCGGKVCQVWIVYCITPQCPNTIRIIPNGEPADAFEAEWRWRLCGSNGWTKAADGYWQCPKCSASK